MKIVVFGASGRTGELVVEKALEEDYEVVAFVRDREKLDHTVDGVTIVEGDALNYEDVKRATCKGDSAVSTIGHAKGSPKYVQTESIKNIITAMNDCDVKRLISMTGAGVRAPEDNPGFVDRLFSLALNLTNKAVAEGAKRHARLIKESKLDWTIVRALRLTDDPQGNYNISYVGKDTRTKTRRSDVAEFIVQELEKEDYLHQTPVVSSH